MFFAPDEQPIVEMFPGVRRQTVSYGANIHIVRVSGEAGGHVPTHSHPHEQIGTVLSGELELTIGDQPPRLLYPGEGYAIPSGVPHSARWPVAGAVFDIFSPVRTEYI